MNFRNMSIVEGSKHQGFRWFILVESMLLIAASISAFFGKYDVLFLILILMELREINSKIKDK